MKPKRTEIIFVLDRSQSMTGLEKDTIGGFNTMLAKQKELPGEAVITTVLFDDRFELLHDRIPLAGVRPITRKEYYVRGSTALLDAIGTAIQKTSNAIAHTAEEQRPEKVIMFITTDGMENSSTEFSFRKISRMIDKQTKKGWEFIFMGANMDAIDVAGRMGIAAERAVTYRADEKGTSLNFKTINEVACALRTNSSLAPDWKKTIEMDVEERGEEDDSSEICQYPIRLKR